MMFGGNAISIFVLYGLLLVRRIHCAHRVDAHERAKRYVTISEAPLVRRELGEKHVAIRDLLGLSENEHMEVSEHTKTVQGTEVWRLHEKYLGVPVFDASLTVSTDETGHLTGDATGEFIQGIEQDISNVTPHLTQTEALNIALKTNGDEEFRNDLLKTKFQLMVYFDDNDSPKARLVYRVEYLVENKNKLERPTFLIDANTGKVVLKWNNLDTASKLVEGVGGNAKIGPIYYDEANRKNYMTKIGDTCFLENDYVKAIDMHNTENSNDTDPVNFPCNYEYEDERNGGFSPALDAFYGANILSKVYREWYGMSPLDEQIIVRVHFGKDFGNAFWDGDYCTFGDGEEDTYPWTSLDIAAHEIGHGITQRFSNLMYFDEAGSINEAFSDMTGELAESYDHENDWMVGADIMKSVDALRFFDNPTKDNVSLINAMHFNDSTDPHYGSGIYNHVFYTIIQEEKVPIKEAYRVFLLANQMYWHQRTTFASGACDVMKAAYDLGKDLSIFRKAFEKVGIEVCDMLKHVIGLKTNRTLTNIRVEPQVHPLFTFAYPPWAINLTIRADSHCDPVHIKISDTNSTMIAEGASEVFIENPPLDKIYIELSPEQSNKLSNVSLIATFDCRMDFEGDRRMDWFWRYYCILETL